ncbi:hypothetical protein B7463_g5944, partial [Scytalidium lignicola]
MIKPCWFWMKRRTTAKGASKSRAEAVKAWEKCWKDLSQSQIQAWIERIPFHIQEIIRIEGGNDYKEGRPKQFKKGKKKDIQQNEDDEWEEISSTVVSIGVG